MTSISNSEEIVGGDILITCDVCLESETYNGKFNLLLSSFPICFK